LLTLLCVSSDAIVIEPPGSFDMGSWMGQLYLDLFSSDSNTTTMQADHDIVKLKDMLLPGSHNAGSYKIQNTSAIAAAADVPTCGAEINGFALGDNFPLETVVEYELRETVNLIETQRVSIFEQLMLGVRFLDLRLGLDQVDGSIRLHHTFFMDLTLAQAAQQVSDFLSVSSAEVVVLKLRPQCGATREQVRSVLETVLGMVHYGGLLTPEILSSTLAPIQGKAYFLWDDETGGSGVAVDEYYRTDACNAVGTSVGRFFDLGSASDGTCPTWPDYNQDQGGWLRDTIADDILLQESQLSGWLPETTDDSFRILSFVGVLPLGQGCDPSSQINLGLAVLSCSGISIDSYTETFSMLFQDVLESLAPSLDSGDDFLGSFNVIQMDYVDTFDLTAIVEINRQTLDLSFVLFEGLQEHSALSEQNSTLPKPNSTAVPKLNVTSNVPEQNSSALSQPNSTLNEFVAASSPPEELESTSHLSFMLTP